MLIHARQLSLPIVFWLAILAGHSQSYVLAQGREARPASASDATAGGAQEKAASGARNKTEMSPEKQALLRQGQEYDRQSAQFYFGGKYAEAIEPMKKSLALYIRSLGPDHYYVGDNYTHLGHMYAGLHDRKNAESAYRKAMAIFEKHSSCQASDAAKGLLRILNETGRQKEAKVLAEKYESLHCPLN